MDNFVATSPEDFVFDALTASGYKNFTIKKVVLKSVIKQNTSTLFRFKCTFLETDEMGTSVISSEATGSVYVKGHGQTWRAER